MKAALIEGVNTPTELPKPINYNLRDSPLHVGDLIIVAIESSTGEVGHNGVIIGPDRILHSISVKHLTMWVDSKIV